MLFSEKIRFFLTLFAFVAFQLVLINFSNHTFVDFLFAIMPSSILTHLSFIEQMLPGIFYFSFNAAADLIELRIAQRVINKFSFNSVTASHRKTKAMVSILSTVLNLAAFIACAIYCFPLFFVLLNHMYSKVIFRQQAFVVFLSFSLSSWIKAHVLKYRNELNSHSRGRAKKAQMHEGCFPLVRQTNVHYRNESRKNKIAERNLYFSEKFTVWFWDKVLSMIDLIELALVSSTLSLYASTANMAVVFGSGYQVSKVE